MPATCQRTPWSRQRSGRAYHSRRWWSGPWTPWTHTGRCPWRPGLPDRHTARTRCGSCRKERPWRGRRRCPYRRRSHAGCNSRTGPGMRRRCCGGRCNPRCRSGWQSSRRCSGTGPERPCRRRRTQSRSHPPGTSGCLSGSSSCPEGRPDRGWGTSRGSDSRAGCRGPETGTGPRPWRRPAHSPSGWWAG